APCRVRPRAPRRTRPRARCPQALSSASCRRPAKAVRLSAPGCFPECRASWLAPALAVQFSDRVQVDLARALVGVLRIDRWLDVDGLRVRQREESAVQQAVARVVAKLFGEVRAARLDRVQLDRARRLAGEDVV